MTEYYNAGGYVLAGFIGALGHYIKKRYLDNTTKCSLFQYLAGNLIYTINMSLNLVWTEILLSLSGGSIMELAHLTSALTLGYFCDSIGNKAPDKK